MTRSEIIKALGEILEDSPLDRDKVLALRDRLVEEERGQPRQKAKAEPDKQTKGYPDLIRKG